MAAVKTFIYIFCVVLFTVVSCQEAQEVPVDDQGDDSFFPLWINCNYTENPGSSCQDCNNLLICTKVGGFVKPCFFPRRRYCVEGRCASEPSEECRTEPAIPLEENPVF